MAKRDGLDNVLTVYMLFDGMEFNGRTIKCGICKEEAAIERANGDRRKEIFRPREPFLQPQMRFQSHKFIREEEQELDGIFEMLKDPLMPKGNYSTHFEASKYKGKHSQYLFCINSVISRQYGYRKVIV